MRVEVLWTQRGRLAWLATRSIQMGPEKGGREGGYTCLPALWYLAALISFLPSQHGSSEISGSRAVPFCSASDRCLIVATEQIVFYHSEAKKNVGCARKKPTNGTKMTWRDVMRWNHPLCSSSTRTLTQYAPSVASVQQQCVSTDCP